MQLQALPTRSIRDRDRRLGLEHQVADISSPETSAPLDLRPPSTDDPLPAGTAEEQLRIAQQNLQVLLGRPESRAPRRRATQARNRGLQRRRRYRMPMGRLSAEPPEPTEKLRRGRLAEAKAEIANLDRVIASKTTEEKRLRGILADYQRRIEAAPTREAELAELTRDYSTFQQAYQTLLVKKQESQISANLERRQIGEQFKILDPARLPEKPSSPDRPKLYLLGIAIALAVGGAFAIFSEYFDRTLRSEEDVQLVLNALVLATIPNVVPLSHTKGRRRVVASGVAAVLLAGIAAAAWGLLR